MIAGYCFAQDTQQEVYRPDQLLANLRSNDPHTRVSGFEEIRSKPEMLRKANVHSALLDLLDLETREGNEQVRQGERRRAEHRDDNTDSIDDNAMYMNDLLETVESFVNWHDYRQICLLAKEGAVLDSTDPRESAARAQVAMPCLQELSTSDLFMNRLNAVKIFVNLLSSAGASLDPETAGAIRKAVVVALRDRRVEVQWEAVDWLERLGTSDMIPALTELAQSAPRQDATKDDVAVRKNAVKAIAAIQNRAGQQ
jgi:hypothetical protein